MLRTKHTEKEKLEIGKKVHELREDDVNFTDIHKQFKGISKVVLKRYMVLYRRGL